MSCDDVFADTSSYKFVVCVDRVLVSRARDREFQSPPGLEMVSRLLPPLLLLVAPPSASCRVSKARDLEFHCPPGLKMVSRDSGVFRNWSRGWTCKSGL